mgnify:CR=1 FL=1
MPAEISIHALRVEGDLFALLLHSKSAEISIHALRVEGDMKGIYQELYLNEISIHALRVEGDTRLKDAAVTRLYFYPRPPGGGRPGAQPIPALAGAFLSTPSGWRATYEVLCKLAAFLFLSTPSGWRATHAKALRQDGHGISIHALRVEGDNTLKSQYYTLLNFYPRPPGGGRRHAFLAW